MDREINSMSLYRRLGIVVSLLGISAIILARALSPYVAGEDYILGECCCSGTGGYWISVGRKKGDAKSRFHLARRVVAGIVGNFRVSCVDGIYIFGSRRACAWGSNRNNR